MPGREDVREEEAPGEPVRGASRETFEEPSRGELRPAVSRFPARPSKRSRTSREVIPVVRLRDSSKRWRSSSMRGTPRDSVTGVSKRERPAEPVVDEPREEREDDDGVVRVVEDEEGDGRDEVGVRPEVTVEVPRLGVLRVEEFEVRDEPLDGRGEVVVGNVRIDVPRDPVVGRVRTFVLELEPEVDRGGDERVGEDSEGEGRVVIVGELGREEGRGVVRVEGRGAGLGREGEVTFGVVVGRGAGLGAGRTDGFGAGREGFAGLEGRIEGLDGLPGLLWGFVLLTPATWGAGVA